MICGDAPCLLARFRGMGLMCKSLVFLHLLLCDPYKVAFDCFSSSLSLSLSLSLSFSFFFSAQLVFLWQYCRVDVKIICENMLCLLAKLQGIGIFVQASFCYIFCSNISYKVGLQACLSLFLILSIFLIFSFCTTHFVLWQDTVSVSKALGNGTNVQVSFCYIFCSNISYKVCLHLMSLSLSLSLSHFVFLPDSYFIKAISESGLLKWFWRYCMSVCKVPRMVLMFKSCIYV